MAKRPTLSSVAAELNEQPSLLSSLRRSKTWALLDGMEGRPIFVGAGDSYAASLCASFLAGPDVLACDPYSLSEWVGWAKGRPVWIISISGQTKSNVDLARRLRGVSKRTVAITSNPESRLAAEVDEVVELPFKPVPRSPGIASFTLSLAACLKACAIESDCDFGALLSSARTTSRKVKVAGGRGVTYFAANNERYAACVYGAAKLYELVGSRSQACLLEEFSHMPLFSLTASDTVNVVGSEDRVGERLCDNLEEGGFDSSLVRLRGDRVESLYHLVFALQIAAIEAAKKRGLREPYFLGARKKLKISDAMIY